MAKTLAELREMHNKMIQEKESVGQKGSGLSDWIELNEGSNNVRFLPGKDDPMEFFLEGSVHKYKDEKGHTKNYKCRRTQGEKCPLCDLYYDLWERHRDLGLGKQPDGKNVPSKFGDMASKIRAKARYYSIVVSRTLQEKGEDPVKYLAMSEQLFSRVMGAMVSDDFVDESDPDNTTIISLDKGNDFDVRLTKQGQWPSFVESAPKFKKSNAGTPAEIAEWMENTLDLKSLVEIGTYEVGKEIVMNIEASLNPVKAENTPEGEITPPWSDENSSEDLKV